MVLSLGSDQSLLMIGPFPLVPTILGPDWSFPTGSDLTLLLIGPLPLSLILLYLAPEWISLCALCLRIVASAYISKTDWSIVMKILLIIFVHPIGHLLISMFFPLSWFANFLVFFSNISAGHLL